MSKVLFEITEEHLDTGLRGYPVGHCVTSFVDPQKGLHYCGKPLNEVAHLPPQEVIYLLKNGKEGNKDEVTAFFQELTKRSQLSEATIKHIYLLPRQGHPMKLLSSSLLLLDMLEGTGDYEQDCLNIIAQLPHLVACLINHHAGWGSTEKPNFSLGYMEAFTKMVNVPEKNGALKDAFKFFNILHYDHGGGNLSAFVGKSIASGLETLLGSLSGAMCGLAGSRHGSANQVTLEFVKEIHNTVGDNATLEDVEKLICERLEKKQLVFGFGHAVLRVEDPRASVLYDFVQKHYGNHPPCQNRPSLKRSRT